MPADNDAVTAGWAVAYVVAALTLLLFTWVAQRCTDAGLVTGKDRRASTSKFQAAMWTYAVGFALFAFLWAWVVDQVVTEVWSSKPWDDDIHRSLGTAFDHLTDKLDETYLLLLGVPLGTAITAKAITQTKVASGDVVKVDKETTAGESPARQVGTAVQELVKDDKGNADLGDFQYFLFNVLAVLYFLVQFLPHPAKGLPDLPDTLVGLTGVAAAAYVAKKGVYSEPPILYSVAPPAAPAGAKVTVFGQRFGGTAAAAGAGGTAGAAAPDPAAGAAAPTSVPVQVIFGSSPASAVEGTDEQLTATIPRHAPAGPVQVRVIRPPGAESNQVPFEVLSAQPKITSLVPATVPPNQEAKVTVNGSGFLDPSDKTPTPSNAVTLDGQTVEAEQWQQDRVVIKVPAIAAKDYTIVVHDWLGRPSEPEKQDADLLKVQ
jgi:hypothetical protein